MAKVRHVETVDYVDVSPLLIQQAIRIYQDWKNLDTEIKSISTRGVNFPGELSEIFACYALGYQQNKKTQGDAYDPKTKRIIEMKGSGSEREDLSSFSPSEDFDELVFIKAVKSEDMIYIYNTGIDSEEFKKIKVNSEETVEDQQKQGRRPRFSVEKSIIKPRGLTPNYKFDILNRKIIEL